MNRTIHFGTTAYNWRKIATEKERLGNATGIIGRSKKGQTRGSKGVPRVDEPPTIAELGLNKKVLQRSFQRCGMR